MTSNLITELLTIANAISRGDVLAYQHNEFFTSGAFDHLLADVNDVQAFELLNDLCHCFSSVAASGEPQSGYYLLLAQLARMTNTTELPDQMAAIMDAHPALCADLKSWYRR